MLNQITWRQCGAVGVLVALTTLFGCAQAPEALVIDSAPSGHLLVLGDWGSGTIDQEEVARAMSNYAMREEVAAILTTGDNFYDDDAASLMQPFNWATTAQIPFWITWGNHDVESGARIKAVNETFDDPPRWGVYEWGNIDLIVLDSTQVDSGEQIAFLEAALGSSQDPTVVTFHHPAYSCGPHGRSDEILDRWVARFDEDVFLVLNGHDHSYQRFEAPGLTFVVTGGGGSLLTDLSACPANHPAALASEEVHHFLALDQNNGSLGVTAFDSEGSIIDDFSLDP